MKKYEIKVQEIKTTIFELSAKNKKEAQEMVEEIIYNTYILNLKEIKSHKSIYFDIRKIKRGIRWKNLLEALFFMPI
mgnify:CR=1 FL=1